MDSECKKNSRSDMQINSNSLIGIRLSRNTTRNWVYVMEWKKARMAITKMKAPYTINSTNFLWDSHRNLFRIENVLIETYTVDRLMCVCVCAQRSTCSEQQTWLNEEKWKREREREKEFLIRLLIVAIVRYCEMVRDIEIDRLNVSSDWVEWWGQSVDRRGQIHL